MTLYEMSDSAKRLYEMLEAGEIDEQTFNDTLEAVGVDEKLESYVVVQRQLEAEIAMFESEIERMEKRKSTLENNVKRLKQAEIDFMQTTGMKSAKAGTFKLSLRETKSVQIDDEAAIPNAYLLEVPASYRPDKKQMLADMKEGKTIAGASIKIGYSVTVR